MSNDPRDKLTGFRRVGGSCLVGVDNPAFAEGYEPFCLGECAEDADWLASRLNLAAQQAGRIATLEAEREALDKRWLDIAAETVQQRDAALAERDAAIAAQARAVEVAEAARQDQARYHWLRSQLLDGAVLRAAMTPETCGTSLDHGIDLSLQQEGASHAD